MSTRLLALIVAGAVSVVIALEILAPYFMAPRRALHVPVPVTNIPRASILVPPDEPDASLPVEGPGWQVIDQLSGHYVRIIRVDTDRIDEAEAIARELVEPVQDTYAEVLVYFYRPATRRVLASVRVQWTPQRGFVTIDYEQ